MFWKKKKKEFPDSRPALFLRVLRDVSKFQFNFSKKTFQAGKSPLSVNVFKHLLNSQVRRKIGDVMIQEYSLNWIIYHFSFLFWFRPSFLARPTYPPTSDYKQTIIFSIRKLHYKIMYCFHFQLFYKGKLLSFDTKDKEQILKLVEEEASRILGVSIWFWHKILVRARAKSFVFFFSLFFVFF